VHLTPLEHAITRVMLSGHHIPVFYLDKWRYDRAVFSIR